MNSEQKNFLESWKVEKIGVIGPGIVGMPMAAMLAHSQIKIGTNEPARVVVVQRNSKTSGWKVDSINKGKSVIGGIEPELDNIVENAVKMGLLSASYNSEELSDADVILVCVQTDKKGIGPDYGPLFQALENLAQTLTQKPADKTPLVIFESTLAPSSMHTVIRQHFEKFGLYEGKNILLGNSPNRVMPGRLVERVSTSDKIVAGMDPRTPQLIKKLYENIVTKGTLYPTNSLTAEVVKTLENAYRDVRIAFSSEIVRYCDEQDLDYYQLRDQVNERLSQKDDASHDPNAVPSGGLLVPTLGVGGHCLPKDGILLWWRMKEQNYNTADSLIWKAREINDNSPAETIKLAERHYGSLDGLSVTLFGAAYRFNSEDTRNAPTLALAKLLLDKGCSVVIHDPYVKPDDQNLLKFGLTDYFTNDVNQALENAQVAFFCTGHREYYEFAGKLKTLNNCSCVVDACNLFRHADFEPGSITYCGIGRGQKDVDADFSDFVYNGFQNMEKGFALELQQLVRFLNLNYAENDFQKIDFKVVQELAASCSTGCEIVDPDPVSYLETFHGFKPVLAVCSEKIAEISMETEKQV